MQLNQLRQKMAFPDTEEKVDENAVLEPFKRCWFTLSQDCWLEDMLFEDILFEEVFLNRYEMSNDDIWANDEGWGHD